METEEMKNSGVGSGVPLAVRIDSQGLLRGNTLAGFSSLEEYLLESDLVSLREAIDRTLEVYKEGNLTDAYIKRLNEDVFEKEIESRWGHSSSKKPEVEKKDDLYIIYDAEADAYKVGRSASPKGRFQQLQIATPHDLELVATFKGKGPKEKEVHALLSNLGCHVRGEWFTLDGEAIEKVRACIEL